MRLAPLPLLLAVATLLPAAPAQAISPFIVFLESGSAELGGPALAILEAAVAAIANSPPGDIEVSGHADRVGSDRFNLELSRRRAEAVRAALVARGVRPDRIRILAFGESRPVVVTADGVPEPQNRFATIMPPYSCQGGNGQRFC